MYGQLPSPDSRSKYPELWVLIGEAVGVQPLGCPEQAQAEACTPTHNRAKTKRPIPVSGGIYDTALGFRVLVIRICFGFRDSDFGFF
jgi:hypothetical protein